MCNPRHALSSGIRNCNSVGIRVLSHYEEYIAFLGYGVILTESFVYLALFNYSVHTKYIVHDRCSDKKYIEHHTCTHTTGYKMRGVKSEQICIVF